jgi:hypothetical protein
MCGGVVGDLIDGAGDLLGDAIEGVGDIGGDILGGLEDVVSGIGDIGGDIIEGVGDLGSSLDDFVNEEIPGGWLLPAAMTAYYFTGTDGGLLESGLGEAAAGEAAASSITPEMIAAANATADPIAALNAAAGWTAADTGYLASLGLGADGTFLPDAIDAGGGWSPADAGSGDAYLPDNIDAGGGYNPATNSSAVPLPGSDAMAADNIDVGGGWNPATGAGDAATAAAALETGVTSSAFDPILGTAGGLTVPSGLSNIAKMIAGSGATTTAKNAIKGASGTGTGTGTGTTTADDGRGTFGQAVSPEYAFMNGQSLNIPMSTLASILGPKLGR